MGNYLARAAHMCGRKQQHSGYLCQASVAAALRLHLSGPRGCKLTSVSSVWRALCVCDTRRLSGNANANQNPLLLSLTIVFVREHNRRARLIEDANPDWSDEKIFQEARR